MTMRNWQLNDPIHAVVFDCDGTLTGIEGIDELAKKNGKQAVISSMTAAAMGKTGLNPQLYEERLAIIQPKQEQVQALANDYYFHRTPHIENVIDLLTQLNKCIYIISAGLLPAVRPFGERLKINAENIYAVDMSFDSAGNYTNFDTTSPLINNDGKKIILQKLMQQHKNILYIGDGLNDLIAKDYVTRFIGFGGYIHREVIANHSDFYLTKPSLLGLLALSLTANEAEQLNDEGREWFKQSLMENDLIP